MRRVLAIIATGALAATLTACDGETITPGPTTATSSGSQPVATPAALEGGAADLGIKWNWNLKPPLQFAQQVGWGETFFEVEYCAVRELPQARRYAQVDRLVGQAQQMGYRMMLKIRVGSCAGGSAELDPAEGTRKRPSTFPDDPAAYTAFVKDLVARYQAKGVKIWAIENEVDANNFWSGTPQQYVDLVALASGAIREADPQAIVLDAGISSTGYGVALAGELLDAGKEDEALALYQQWYERRLQGASSRFPRVESVAALRTLLADGRAKRVREMVAANWQAVNAGGVSAYQLHFYENPTLLPTLLDYIRRHLTRPLPIQGWEIGTAWPGSAYTPEQHGAETAQMLATLLRERVSPVVYLPLAYTPGGATKEEIFRGLVSPDGAVQPAGEVYAALAAATKTSTAIHEIDFATGSGTLIEGPSASYAVVWPKAGQDLQVSSDQARSAARPSAAPSGERSLTPVLLPLPGGQDAARDALSTALGSPVTLAG